MDSSPGPACDCHIFWDAGVGRCWWSWLTHLWARRQTLESDPGSCFRHYLLAPSLTLSAIVIGILVVACRGGQVLVVVADAPVGKKADTRLGSRALAAAKEAGAGRFVLITPQGGAASGGGLLGIFNLGGGGSGGQSRLEKEVRSC